MAAESLVPKPPSTIRGLSAIKASPASLETAAAEKCVYCLLLLVLPMHMHQSPATERGKIIRNPE